MHNAEHTLPSTLASIRRQTLRSFECIVVDDGSSDGSAAVVQREQQRDRRFRLVSQSHSGIVAALNRGLAACTAPFVVRMNADDWMHPERPQLHPGRIGQTIAGAAVIAPGSLTRRFSRNEGARLPLAISVARAGPRGEARYMAANLNLREGLDFVCVA